MRGVERMRERCGGGIIKRERGSVTRAEKERCHGKINSKCTHDREREGEQDKERRYAVAVSAKRKDLSSVTSHEQGLVRSHELRT